MPERPREARHGPSVTNATPSRVNGMKELNMDGARYVVLLGERAEDRDCWTEAVSGSVNLSDRLGCWRFKYGEITVVGYSRGVSLAAHALADRASQRIADRDWTPAQARNWSKLDKS